MNYRVYIYGITGFCVKNAKKNVLNAVRKTFFYRAVFPNGKSENFVINSYYKKECFLQEFDDIDYLLSKKDKIEDFENNQKYA